MKLTKMQKVLGVLVTSSLLCIQCATTKEQGVSEEIRKLKKLANTKQYSTNNVIKVYKSKNELFTGFKIDAHIDNEHKMKIPAGAYINNIYFSNYAQYHGIDSVSSILFRVKANQKYKLNIFSMGYNPTKKMKIFVKQGDSVVVKSYLKEDDRMIFD